MSPDLKYLLFSTILCFVQVLIAATGANQQVGLPKLAGNREDVPAYTGWAGRAKRAHLNMLENLVLFAVLLFGARAAGAGGERLALGAAVFFWARVGYFASYLAGIRGLRTLLWAVSIGGLAMILAAAF